MSDSCTQCHKPYRKKKRNRPKLSSINRFEDALDNPAHHPRPDPDTNPPKFKVPEGAADCHFHIFGPETDYPYAEPRRYTPPQVLESDYRKMADALVLRGASWCRRSPYGADNARVIEAVRGLGPGYVGVGVVDADAPRSGSMN